MDICATAQIRRKVIKKFFTIVITLVLIAGLVPIGITLLLSNKAVQSWAIQLATEQLSTITGGKVTIGEIAFIPFHELQLREVSLQEPQGDSLASLSSLRCSFRIRPLLSKRLVLDQIRLDRVNFHLKADSTGITNLQFLLDAFATDSPPGTFPLTILAPDIQLTDSRFSLDMESVPENLFGPMQLSHLRLENIQLHASLDELSTDTLQIRLYELVAKETSGLDLNRLSLLVRMGKHGIHADDFDLQMPSSRLRIDSLVVQCDSLQQLAQLNRPDNTIQFFLSIAPSHLHPSDFQALYTALSGLSSPVYFSGNATLSYNLARLSDFHLRYGEDIMVNCEASITDLSHPEETYLWADVKHISATERSIEEFIHTFSGQPFRFSEQSLSPGKVSFRGNLSGFFSDIVAYGELGTPAGSIRTDILVSVPPNKKDIRFQGSLETERFNLKRLLQNQVDLQNLSLNIRVDGEKKQNHPLYGSLQGQVSHFTFQDYNFQNINLNGKYSETEAGATLSFHDQEGNGDVNVEATLYYGQAVKELGVDVRIDSLHPYAMHLIPQYPDLRISLQTQARLLFSSVDDILGFVRLDSLLLRGPSMSQRFDPFLLTAKQSSNGVRQLQLQSPLLNAKVEGQLKPSTLANNLQALLYQQLPAIHPLKAEKQSPGGNRFYLEAEIMPLEPLSTLMNWPVVTEDSIYISGWYDDLDDQVELTLRSPLIELPDQSLDSLSLVLHNMADSLVLDARTILKTPSDTSSFYVHLGTQDNRIGLLFDWHNTMDKEFSGQFISDFLFQLPQKPNHTWDVTCHIKPSTLILGDSVFQVGEGFLHYDEDELSVQHLAFEGNTQYLRINGISKKEDWSDIIEVELKEIDLSYISDLAIPDVQLMGLASGKVTIGEALHKPILDANVQVKQFGMNQKTMADVWARATYNYDLDQIDLDADVVNADNDSSRVTGYVSIVRNEMLLDIDINRLHIGLIEQYMSSFSHEFDGIASGKLYVGGDFDAIQLWGDAKVDDGVLGVDFIGTRFHLNGDSVHIKKDSILFENIHLLNDNGEPIGTVQGILSHHLFQDFKYNIGFQIDNALVMNTTAANSPDFYGTIYASGTALIQGDLEAVNIHVFAKPEKGSYFAVPLDKYVSASDNQFITYEDHSLQSKQSPEERRKKRLENIVPSTNINVDLTVEATPDVEAQIVMDSHSGDIIKARGAGNIKVTIDKETNVKLYGKYEVQQGEYNFSMQGAVRKKFEVQEGGSISFEGDPLNGQLNMTAMYQTTASLNDLLEESLLSDIKNHTVRVNCLANITGPLQQLKIKFDLQLPNADDEVQRRVKATVNTEDMMSQQMVFLLLMGRFYNPSLTNRSSGNTMAASFATATISSQLNYWMSQISDAVNLGVNYQEDSQDAVNNRSFAVNLSTELFNNRLIINSNIGYRTQYGSNDIIGDVDLEYKLVRSGRLRLKVYNHTNDKLYSTSLYTQGLGLMYREDFDTWRHLGKTYKEAFRKKTPEEKEAAQKAKDKEKAEKAKEKENRRLLREDRRRRHKLYVAEQKAARAAAKEAAKAAKAAAKVAKEEAKKAAKTTP